MIKKILLGLVAIILLAAAGGGAFAYTRVSAFNESLDKTYDVALAADVQASTDPAIIERGKHLSESLGGCQACHGQNYGGGKVEAMGPVGTFKMWNITAGKNGKLAEYSDAELARLLEHGIKKNGKGVIFMPAQDFAWWPKEDIVALISYLRTVPPVDGEPGTADIGPLGKILDRQDALPLDVARRIDHATKITAPAPAETAEYGGYVAKLCTGCHGQTLAGGPIPGAPPELPVPLNLTMHESGLKDWTFADFDKLMKEGMRKNGQKLNPFMPVETTKNFNETEMKALWAYLQKLPAKPLGDR